MARPAGRDQSAPMERLVRLLGVLGQHPTGAPLDLLLRAVAPDDTGDEARRRMLSRDLEHLNALGYDIRNTAAAGEDGRYVMRARDNRLQLTLTPQQRGELLRAAVGAGLEDLRAHLEPGAVAPQVPPAQRGNLDLVQRATTRRCRVAFTYKGERRTVHPARVHSGPSGWYLTGREVGQEVVKEFVVSRMADVSLDAPGTADAVSQPARPSLDPLTWLEDAPTEVVLAVGAEHRLLAENLLGTPTAAVEDGDSVRLTYTVTHRAVLRWRLWELGTRVRVVGPPEVRAELLAELEAHVEGWS